MKILRTLWEKWKKIAHRIGVFQSRVILTIFYFTFLLPLGFAIAFTQDKLKMKTVPNSSWIPKDKQAETLEELRKQY